MSCRRCSFLRSRMRPFSFRAATAASKLARSSSSRSGHTFSNAMYRTWALAPLDPEVEPSDDCRDSSLSLSLAGNSLACSSSS
eukprot:5411912-Pleurochrysis_carterae.AAC.1